MDVCWKGKTDTLRANSSYGYPRGFFMANTILSPLACSSTSSPPSQPARLHGLEHDSQFGPLPQDRAAGAAQLMVQAEAREVGNRPSRATSGRRPAPPCRVDRRGEGVEAARRRPLELFLPRSVRRLVNRLERLPDLARPALNGGGGAPELQPHDPRGRIAPREFPELCVITSRPRFIVIHGFLCHFVISFSVRGSLPRVSTKRRIHARWLAS